MRQKRVSAGQKISGNLSAAAINALPRLIENDQMREMNKPGVAIPHGEGAGLFVYGADGNATNVGEWEFINCPAYPRPSYDVNEASFFQQTEMRRGANPNQVGSLGLGAYLKNLCPAMLVAPKQSGNFLSKYQIAGLARTKIQFPVGSDATDPIYRTAHIGTNLIPMATDTDAGDMDIIWHQEIDAANRIHAAIVRVPAIPRPPRLVQIQGEMNSVSHSTPATEFSVFTYHTPATPYYGIKVGGSGRPTFRRGGMYKITVGLWVTGAPTVGSGRTGRVHVRCRKVSPLPLSNATDVYGWLVQDPDGDQVENNAIFATGAQVWDVRTGDELILELIDVDATGINLRVQLHIEGPYNNHYPEVLTYF